MKRILALSLSLCMVPILGCPAASTKTPPAALAPGFTNTQDQDMDQILVGAHVFYTDIQSKAAAGTYVPSPTEKTALNSFASALNIAQTLYRAYHAGTASEAQAKAAVDVVAAQQASLQSTITTGAK
jgi:hypothetical protein